MMERELIPLLQGMGQPRIAVVGDFMLDRTIWGEASRVSPEAPVPVVQVDREEDRPGGAGNVEANLVELGATVSCFGAVGTDESATLLIQGLDALGVETQGMVACTDRPTAQKIVLADDTSALNAALESFRREGARLVFTNGCFDILHAGHVRYLGQSRQFGDALVVGLNADASVRRLKGTSRPIHSEEDRAEILAGLECVDLVVLFEEDTPKKLIERVCPDVLVKGADWKDKGVVGADFVEAQGGEVRLVDILPGRSTTSVVDQMQKE